MSDAIQQQAHKDAGELQNNLATGQSAQDVYDKFMKDLQNHGSGSAADTNYQKAMAKELADRGLLPTMSAVMAQQEWGSKLRTDDYGRLTTGRVDDALDNVHLQDPIHQAELNTIKQSYADIAGTPSYSSDGTQENIISKDDVDKAVRVAQTRYQGEHAINQLLSNNGALFNAIDKVQGGAADGQISKRDLETFVKDDTNFDGGPRSFTQADKQAAQWLLDNFDNPDVKLNEHHYLTSNKITRDSLALAMGYGSEKDPVQALANDAEARAAQEAADAGDVRKPDASGGGTTGLDKAHATDVMGLLQDGVLKPADKGAITQKDVQDALANDDKDGGKDLTQAQRDTLKYLNDHFNDFSSWGDLTVKDMAEATGMDADALGKWNDQRTQDKQNLSSALKNSDFSDIAKNGAISKDDLDAKLTKVTTEQPDSDQAKNLKLIDDNFNQISHDGKTITADDILAARSKGEQPATPAESQPSADESLQQKFMKQAADSITQVRGQGPWDAANKLAAQAGGLDNDTILKLAHVLKRSYQQHNDDPTDNLAKLKVGYQWVNSDNIGELLQNETFRKVFQAIAEKKLEAANNQPPGDVNQPNGDSQPLV